MMNRIRHLLIRAVLFASLTVGCASHGRGQDSSTKVEPPILVRIEANSGGGVMRGTPLSLQWIFTSKSSDALTILLEDNLAWASFDLRNESGTVYSWHPKIRRKVGFNPIQAGKFDVSEPFEMAESTPSDVTDVPEGKYSLHIRTKIRYGTSALARSSSLWGSKDFIEQDVVVPVTVLPADPETIRKRISTLYRSVLKESGKEERKKLYYQLAKMPPAYAQRIWRTLLQSEEIDRYQFADVLASVVSKPVVDTLIYVQFTNPIRDGEGRIRNLVDLLNGMAMSSTPQMSAYIRQEVAKHRDSIFNAPIIID